MSGLLLQCTPYIFQVATLKRSQRNDSPMILSDLVFPTNKIIKEALYLLSQESRQMLTGLASDLGKKLLNFRNLTSKYLPAIGQYVYVPDCIIRKKVFLH